MKPEMLLAGAVLVMGLSGPAMARDDAQAEAIFLTTAKAAVAAYDAERTPTVRARSDSDYEGAFYNAALSALREHDES